MSFTLLKQLVESLEEIQIDDKAGPYDVADLAFKAAAKIAVNQMAILKDKHELSKDEDDEPFDDSVQALADLTEEVVNEIIERLNDKTVKDYLNVVKPLFKKD